MSYGSGIHFCLGAQLTLLEAAEFLARLLRGFPDLELAGTLQRRPGRSPHGFAELHIAARTEGLRHRAPRRHCSLSGGSRPRRAAGCRASTGFCGTCISRFGAVRRLQCMTADAFTIFFRTATDRTLAVRVAWLPTGVLMCKALLAGGAWGSWLSCRAVRACAREGGGAGSGCELGWPDWAGGVLGAGGSGLIPARLHPVAAGWLR